MLMTIAPADLGLLTDLYQITMSACYVGEGLDDRSTSFELFARKLPKDFGYLIAMGLEQVLSYLESLQITSQQIEQLQETGLFEHAPDRFWELLKTMRFEGSVWAVSEGTAVFANEPLLRIEAPLWQAQWVETYVLNVLNYQTLVATRSARIRDVAGDDAKLYEFGSRRAFSPQGAVWAARAALAAGFDGTSNVLAATQLGRVPVGTMAHALVMAIGAVEGGGNSGEDRAFQAFHRYFPGAPLLIDTYDTIAAAKRLAANPPENLAGVRIDSGDLGAQSKEIRALLPGIAIVASGDLDEYRIQELRNQHACIDGFGIGTQLVTGTPVNGVYKLVEIDGIPVMKNAPGKQTYPGRKQIFRTVENGTMNDRLGLASEEPKPDETGLLVPVMQAGKRVKALESLEHIAARTRRSVLALPLEARPIFATGLEVELSDSLIRLQESCL